MRRLLALLLLATASLSAQVTVEAPVTDDTISVLLDANAPREKKSSVLKYYLASVLLPGAGQLMSQQPNKAFVFIAADAGLIAGAVFTLLQSRDILTESRGYAAQYSGTRSTRAADDAYWRFLAEPRFTSSEDFNLLAETTGETDLEYLSDNDQWLWNSEFSRTHYRKLRDASTRYKTVGSFLLGALIIDRAIAMLDIRIGVRRGTISALPLYDPVSQTGAIVLAGTF